MNKRFLLFLLLFALFIGAVIGGKALFFPPAPAPEVTTARINPVIRAEAEKTIYAFLQTSPGPAFPLPLKELTACHDEVHREAKKKLAEAEAARRKDELGKVKDEPIILGAAQKYKLEVAISRPGAAIKWITLNEYYAAERSNARPTHQKLILVNDDDDGKLKDLPADKRLEHQSYRLLIEGVPLVWEYTKRIDEEEETHDPDGHLTKVIFVANVPEKNLRIIKTFGLKLGQYHVDMKLRFQPLNGQKTSVVYTLTGPRGVPVEGQVWKTSPYRQIVVGTVDPVSTRTAYRHLVDAQSIRKEEVKLPTLNGPKITEELLYAGVMVQYFAALAIVDNSPGVHETVDTTQRAASWIDKVTAELTGNDEPVVIQDVIYPPSEKLQGRITANLTSRPIELTGGKAVEQNYMLYAGPAKVSLLNYEAGMEPGLVEKYDTQLHLDMLTDYPTYTWLGKIGFTSLVVYLTNWMHWLLENLSWLMGGRYWAAIILLTVIVRALMFPISRKQAMTSIRMQKLAPELKKLQEKHPTDMQARSQAQWELYRKHGVNPFSGCLVVLLQMPVFMGLYYALYESVHLRLAEFLWIENLAAPDMLFFWDFIPGWSSLTRWLNLGPYFNILPMVSIVLMYLQQKLLMPPPTDDQAAMNQKIMNLSMFLFAYMFYWVASGLCLYFIISGAWGMLERKLLPRLQRDKADKPAAVPAKTVAERPRAKSSKNGEANGLLGRIASWWNELLEQARKK